MIMKNLFKDRQTIFLDKLCKKTLDGGLLIGVQISEGRIRQYHVTKESFLKFINTYYLNELKLNPKKEFNLNKVLVKRIRYLLILLKLSSKITLKSNFMKIVHALETDEDIVIYPDFIEYSYGLNSFTLSKDLNCLENLRWIEVRQIYDDENNKRGKDYSLSPKVIEIVNSIYKDFSKDEILKMKKVLRLHKEDDKNV